MTNSVDDIGFDSMCTYYIVTTVYGTTFRSNDLTKALSLWADNYNEGDHEPQHDINNVTKIKIDVTNIE